VVHSQVPETMDMAILLAIRQHVLDKEKSKWQTAPATVKQLPQLQKG
jgi:hypothetical protein